MNWMQLLHHEHTNIKTIWSDHYNGTITETHKNSIPELQILYHTLAEITPYFTVITAKLLSNPGI